MSYDPKHLELYWNGQDGPWIDIDTNRTSLGLVYNSHRCKTRDAAKRKAERYAKSSLA